MTLREYLATNGTTQAFAAKSLGVSKDTIYGWCNEKWIPRHEMMRKIHDWTDGAVDANSFYGIG